MHSKKQAEIPFVDEIDRHVVRQINQQIQLILI